jgi:putative oxygen-independent coproporphyrinogen III oxidase
LSVLPPLSLYVHFPWCVRKCPYCDFNSFALRGELPEADYVDTLLTDLTQQSAWLQQREVDSIFFGGGTPSLFSPAALAGLLEGVRRQCRLSASVEVTMEANPGAIERGRFAEYRAAGITRVSLGAQSFDDGQLQRLGRVHSSADTAVAATELHAAGLQNFNLDLMYGLPDQTVQQALADLERAISLQPVHLSHYQLTLEAGTVFAGQPPAGMPDTDLAGDIQLACQARLEAAGFRQYEVSAYAREGSRCRHNLNYWHFADYLGLGAGAHGKVSHRDGTGLKVARTIRPREPRRYPVEVAQGAVPELRVVSHSELPFEYLLNALRLTDGFEQLEFERRTGLAFDIVAAPLAEARQAGLMEQTGQHWRPSALGLNFLNDLLARFLPTGSQNDNLSGSIPLKKADTGA